MQMLEAELHNLAELERIDLSKKNRSRKIHSDRSKQIGQKIVFWKSCQNQRSLSLSFSLSLFLSFSLSLSLFLCTEKLNDFSFFMKMTNSFKRKNIFQFWKKMKIFWQKRKRRRIFKLLFIFYTFLTTSHLSFKLLKT